MLNRSVPHENLPVTDDEAIAAARALAKSEGIFCGISSGGTFAAALKVAEKAPKGSVILAMLPDTGERYLTHGAVRGHAGRLGRGALTPGVESIENRCADRHGGAPLAAARRAAADVPSARPGPRSQGPRKMAA